jgi:hypothetical protein
MSKSIACTLYSSPKSPVSNLGGLSRKKNLHFDDIRRMGAMYSRATASRDSHSATI